MPRFIRDMCPSSIFRAWFAFWTKFPRRVWNFYINCLLIPKYREWGKYKAWDYRSARKKRDIHKPHIHEKKKKKHPKLTDKNGFPRAIKHNHNECQQITINVCGSIYTPQLRTLQRYPDTLLGNPKKLEKYYDPARQDFFIDRSRVSFESIMYYYQSGGILRRPHNVPVDMFFEELLFYELGDTALNRYREDEGVRYPAEKEGELPKNLLQRKIWLLFEYPESSLQARIVAILSVLVIAASIVIFCVETLQIFQYTGTFIDYNVLKFEGFSDQDDENPDLSDPFYLVETICMAWFVFELLIRLFSCPRKSQFLQDVMNVIDVVAIIPYFLGLATTLAEKDDEQDISLKLDILIDGEDGDFKSFKNVRTSMSLAILRVIRLVRVFRILKLSRHSQGLQVLGKTLKASLAELGLLMFFLIIGIILFSSAVYFAEVGAEDADFHSIPGTFWWAVITMTTVGGLC